MKQKKVQNIIFCRFLTLETRICHPIYAHTKIGSLRTKTVQQMLGAVHIGTHVQGPYTRAYKHISPRPILSEGQHNRDYQQIDHMAQSLL